MATFHERDHLFFEPNEILKGDGGFYQVYSPFSRNWFARMDSVQGRHRLQQHSLAGKYFSKQNKNINLFKMKWTEISVKNDFPFHDTLAQFEKENSMKVTISIPEAGFYSAFEQFRKFKPKLATYGEGRDVPSLDGTSGLSIYFKNGSLTVPQVLAQLDTEFLHWNRNDGPTKFIKELVWREFYYSILYHRPDVETQAFLPQYQNLKWENDKNYFDCWKEGMTGFPIVDAGMRQLKTTGWMHNRVRMIVASFLTKDLLIDWRWGENHFMKELLDGDLAPNNGGWQWAASTGCDPQPYFRIFNPWLQSQKFDPDGVYIKKYIPELKNAPSKILHNPDGHRSVWGYPKPIVNHSVQRDKALALYK